MFIVFCQYPMLVSEIPVLGSAVFVLRLQYSEAAAA